MSALGRFPSGRWCDRVRMPTATPGGAGDLGLADWGPQGRSHQARESTRDLIARSARPGRRYTRSRPRRGPTNNAAERALRHAVCWRKTSYGTDSAGGSRFVERVLTVVATCRQQGRSVLAFLTACCRASVQGGATPTLVP